MPVEQHGAKGEMYLDYWWEESASSHRDQYRITKLTGHETTVELEITSADHIASKSSYESSGARYSIPVKDLIAFIKEKGKKLPRRKPEA